MFLFNYLFEFVVLICLMVSRFTRDKDGGKVISYKEQSDTPAENQPKTRSKNIYYNKIKISLFLK